MRDNLIVRAFGFVTRVFFFASDAFFDQLAAPRCRPGTRLAEIAVYGGSALLFFGEQFSGLPHGQMSTSPGLEQPLPDWLAACRN